MIKESTEKNLDASKPATAGDMPLGDPEDKHVTL